MNQAQIKRRHENTSDMEKRVLGAILMDNSVLNEIDLVPEAFMFQSHRVIYEEMLSLHADRLPIDSAVVNEKLKRERNMDVFIMLIECIKGTPSARNAKAYADHVKSYYKSRRALEIASQLSEIQNDNEQSHIDDAIKALMSLSTTNKSHNHDIKTIMHSALTEIDIAFKSTGETTGLATGLKGLDIKLGGFHKSDLVIIGARPAMGKTALLLNMLTRNPDSSPGICSAEQGHHQIGTRLVSIHGGVNGARIRNGSITDEEWTKITCSVGLLRDRNIWVNDKPSMTIDDIERQARQWVHEKQVNVIGVDYIQKIKHSNKNLSNVDRISDVAERLKELAKELDVPVIALAQVNRGVETRADKRPQMSDIKDCGVVEQEADQVMTLYRDEVYEASSQRRGLADISVCKNRHGPLGIVTTQWVSKYMQFNDMPNFNYDKVATNEEV